jgi:hypothetical protein
LTGPNCHRTSQQQLSWGLLPFSDISSGGPVHSGLPRPTPSDSRVSHPLAGLRPPEPSGLVSCRYRSWGSPSGPFPLAEPSFLSKPVTFLTLNKNRSTSSELDVTRTHPRLQGFALCKDSTPFEEGSTSSEGRCPPGLPTSKGVSLAVARRLRAGSPHELHGAPGTRRRQGTRCSSGCRPPRGRLVSCETATLSGLLAPCLTAANSDARHVWLIVSPCCSGVVANP